jgi:hypothetical protein
MIMSIRASECTGVYGRVVKQMELAATAMYDGFFLQLLELLLQLPITG